MEVILTLKEIVEETNLRKKVWKIINVTQANQLFVHSKNIEISNFDSDTNKIKKQYLPEILTISVLNAIVPNSAALLVGGHGGGKTSLVKVLGRMFTGNSLSDIESSIIRGHN